ncbi:MAG TPA: hypothetical protein VHN81_13380 [Edaphobacter sp.]|nr:hypothetical protein [Edaphobacter sp.]
MSTFDPTDLRGQDRDKAEVEAKKRIAKDQEDKDLKWLMASPKGRRIMWRLLEEAGVFRISFSTNAMRMAFAEGNGNYGNKLLNSIHELCPELYPVMVQEAASVRNIGDGNGAKSN